MPKLPLYLVIAHRLEMSRTGNVQNEIQQIVWEHVDPYTTVLFPLCGERKFTLHTKFDLDGHSYEYLAVVRPLWGGGIEVQVVNIGSGTGDHFSYLHQQLNEEVEG